MTSPSTTNITNGAPTKPGLTDREVRLECVKQAVILNPGSQGVISLAERMANFVLDGSSS